MAKVPAPKKQIKAPNPYGALPAEPPNLIAGPDAHFVYDLSALHTYNGSLVAGLSSVAMAREQAKFLLPQEVANFQAWSSTHPTVDPRTWVPAARMGVHPQSPEGSQLARADLARQTSEGVHGLGVGNPANPPQTPKNGDGGGGGVFGWMHHAADAVGHAAGVVSDDSYNLTKGAVRGTLTGLAAPFEGLTGAFRSTGGDEAKRRALIEKYHLSKSEADAAFLGHGKNEALTLEAGPTGTDAQKNLAAATYLSQHGALPTWSFDQAARARMNAAQQEWNTTGRQATGQSLAGAVVEQTELGQVIKDPSLLTQSLDKDGKVIQQRSWLPSQVGQARAEAKAVQAWNITTAEERARQIAPLAWTPGRGLAHIWWSPDESAFNAMSGTVDAANSLTFDPVNLLPLGVVGKAVRAPNIVARRGARALGANIAPDIGQAFKTGAYTSKVVVSSPTKQFQKALRDETGEIVRDENGMAVVPRGGRGVAGARPGARAAVTGALETGATKVLEPSLKVDNAGRVLTPHGNFVMTRAAWDWLGQGRGAKVVSQLAAETSPTKIWLRSGRKMDMDLALHLSEATTPAEVRAILGSRMGYQIGAPDLGSIGRSGPALFKNRAMLDSAGLFSVTGRRALGTNFNALREAGVDEGLIRSGARTLGAGLTAASSIGVGIFRQAPETRTLNLEDADVTATQLEAFLRGTRIPTEDATRHIDNVLRTRTGAERYRAIYGDGGLLEAGVRKALVDQGLTEGHATAITRAFEGGLGDFNRHWFNDSIADGYGSAPGNVGRVLLENEQLSKTAVLPDYRTLRRTTSSIGRIMASKGSPGEITDRVADALHGTTSVWRQIVLLRPAYVFRELGELAFATSLGGYRGLLTHPGAFIAAAHQTALAKEVAVTSNRASAAVTGAWARRGLVKMSEGIAHLNPSFESHAAWLNGDGMWDQANRVIAGGSSEQVASMFDGLSSIHGNFQLDEAGARSMAKAARVLSRDNPAAATEYLHALVEKIEKASGDRDMRNLADPAMTRKAVRQAFLDGTYEQKRIMRPDLLTGTPKSIERYLEGYRDLLQKTTFGDEALLEAVRTGKFNGQSLIDKSNGRNKIKVQTDLRKHLEAMLADPDKRLLMPETLHSFGSTYSFTRWGREFANDFFTSTGEWSDLFFRAPMIREAYTRRVISLADDLSPAARADAIANLRKAGDAHLAFQVAQTQVNRAGTLGIDEVDAIASGFARKEVARVFYDAHKRQNYALALRTVMPFAQATFNTFRRWGEMSLRNPQLMYRTTKPVEALTDPGSAAIYGIMSDLIPGDDGLDSFYSPHDESLGADGFFFTDSYGDRKYAYPMQGALANLMPGSQPGAVGIGSWQGLNVAGVSLFPGAGPLITIGESMVVPESIYHDDAEGAVLRAVNPYGLPQGSLMEKLGGAFATNWMRRLQNTSDPEAAANGTMKALPALLATGEYDMNSPSDQRRAINDAKALSESMGLLDSLGVSIAPGSFTTQFLVSVQGDRTGDVRRMMVADKLAQEYRKYVAAGPGQDPLVAQEQGRARFLQDFGRTALLSVVPRTQVDGPQATNDVWHWRSQNPESYTENQPVVGYFFAGGDQQGTFSQNLYRWQQATKERKPKDPNDFLTDANQEMGWLRWNAMIPDIDRLPADQQAVARARARDDIEKKFPGWTGKASDLGAFDTRMNQVRDALNDPHISSLASADYIETYIKTRDDAMADLRDRFGVTTLDSKTAQAAGITDQLLNMAQRLRQQDTSGGFTNAWSRLFSQEFSGVDNG